MREGGGGGTGFGMQNEKKKINDKTDRFMFWGRYLGILNINITL